MAGQITLIDAVVKYTAGSPRDTQRGPRINIVCALQDGTEEMPSLHPLIDHIPNALSGYFCDGFVQGFLVSLGITDSLRVALVLSLVFALGLGLDEHRQGEGVGMKFDKVRAGHGGN